MHRPTDRITHTTAFGTPVVEHWLERKIAEWVHHESNCIKILFEKNIYLYMVPIVLYTQATNI